MKEVILRDELEKFCARLEEERFGNLGAYETIEALRFLIDGHTAEDVNIYALGCDYEGDL